MTAHAPATWIKQPLAVFTANDLDAAGGIVVREDRIVELVGRGKEPETRIDSVVDASGRVLLPGLINGHHHFYQTLTRAHPPALNKPLFDWLKTLYPVWATPHGRGGRDIHPPRAGRADALRLHHGQRPSLPVFVRADAGD